MPAGQVGEIWVSGPSVAQGYWQRTDETEQTFRAHLQDTGEGPFLRTGDLGFTHDGELFVTGRLKDLIIVHGVNHYPQDIEATAAKSHPGVRAGLGAAFTVEEGPEPKLVIVQELERRQRTEAPQVIEAIRRDGGRRARARPSTRSCSCAPGASPRPPAARSSGTPAAMRSWTEAWTWWPSGIGQGATGRPLPPPLPAVGRRAWSRHPETESLARQPSRLGQRPLAAHRRRTGAAQRPAGQTLEATAEIVLDEVRSIGKDRTVGLELDSPIVELGLDSLERMEILASLEEHFGGRFPDQVIAELDTCREVVDAVEKYLGTAATAAGRRARPRSRRRTTASTSFRNTSSCGRTSRCSSRRGWATRTSRSTSGSPTTRP